MELQSQTLVPTSNPKPPLNKVSINGAQRLKGDVDYFKNWIQTSPMVPAVSFLSRPLVLYSET